MASQATQTGGLQTFWQPRRQSIVSMYNWMQTWLLRFNKNHHLSLTLTKVLVLRYIHDPPQPPPYDFTVEHKCNDSNIPNNIACEHNTGSNHDCQCNIIGKTI